MQNHSSTFLVTSCRGRPKAQFLAEAEAVAEAIKPSVFGRRPKPKPKVPIMIEYVGINYKNKYFSIFTMLEYYLIFIKMKIVQLHGLCSPELFIYVFKKHLSENACGHKLYIVEQRTKYKFSPKAEDLGFDLRPPKPKPKIENLRLRPKP